jgi:hypothetical protein
VASSEGTSDHHRDAVARRPPRSRPEAPGPCREEARHNATRATPGATAARYEWTPSANVSRSGLHHERHPPPPSSPDRLGREVLAVPARPDNTEFDGEPPPEPARAGSASAGSGPRGGCSGDSSPTGRSVPMQQRSSRKRSTPRSDPAIPSSRSATRSAFTTNSSCSRYRCRSFAGSATGPGLPYGQLGRGIIGERR